MMRHRRPIALRGVRKLPGLGPGRIGSVLEAVRQRWMAKIKPICHSNRVESPQLSVKLMNYAGNGPENMARGGGGRGVAGGAGGAGGARLGVHKSCKQQHGREGNKQNSEELTGKIFLKIYILARNGGREDSSTKFMFQFWRFFVTCPPIWPPPRPAMRPRSGRRRVFIGSSCRLLCLRTPSTVFLWN